MVTQTRATLPIIAALAVAVCIAGCHRGFYRRQANVEAQRLISEKTNDPRWQSPTGDITVDPQSRMFNPFSEDHPPMPKDDPASHQLMHSVDGKPGYPQWHSNGDTNYAENPEWMAYLPTNENGEVVIDLDRAVDLAYIHSTVYQQQKETLYLSALDVSLERFDFDGQLATGFSSFFNTQGRLAPGGSASTLTNALGVNGGGLNWEKLGITGTNFAVGLANTVMWNFAGANNQSVNSLIDFSIIQPFLRGAGRQRILEALTQSERDLLANVRQMDRFRRGFYMQVAVGRSPGAGPGANFLGSPQGASGAGGFVGLLQTRQQIRNQEFAVRQVQNVLNQFNELFDSDQIDNLQLVQVESQLYQEQQDLLSIRRNYQDALDRFKETIGVPPYVKIVIDDSFLDRFELTSDEINNRQVSLDELRARTGSSLIRLGELIPKSDARPMTREELAGANADQIAERRERLANDPNRDFASNKDIDKRVAELLPFLDEALEVVKKVREKDRKQIEVDLAKLDQARPERVKYLNDLKDFVSSGKLSELGEISSTLFDVGPESLATLEDYLGRGGRSRLGLTNQLVGTMEKVETVEESLLKIKDLIKNFPEARDAFSESRLYEFVDNDLLGEIPKQLTDLFNNILELSLIQAQSRSNSIGLIEIDLDSEVALEIARCMRLDWMNARAALVDSWRQVEVIADQLEAQLDLVFQGSIGNFGDTNPFKIRTETGTLSMGLRFDSPIVRQVERNNYRATLIRYQQARRSYYRFEDEVSRNLRQSLRGTNLNKILFELNRRNIQASIVQVEQARLRLEEPGQGNQGGFGNTIAQDLLRAIQGLQGAQNGYLNVWVSYEVARRNLDFDLGTMQLDGTGRWIDPGVIDESIGHRAAARLGIDPSCLDCGMSNIGQMPTMQTDGSGNMAPQDFNYGSSDTGELIEQPQFETEPGTTPGPADVEPLIEMQSPPAPNGLLDPQSGSRRNRNNPLANSLDRALRNRSRR